MIKNNWVYYKIMGNKLCPKVILEGTRLTFKMEIAFEWNEHARVVGPRKYRYTRRCTPAFRIMQRIRRGSPLGCRAQPVTLPVL